AAATSGSAWAASLTPAISPVVIVPCSITAARPNRSTSSSMVSWDFRTPGSCWCRPTRNLGSPVLKRFKLYRQRMQLEHCLRDWKSHLGLRGLRLQVQKPERLLRLLMGFTLAYLITLLLGQDLQRKSCAPNFEQQRLRARHGTHKVLSVLSLAL